MNSQETLWFIGKCLSLAVHPERAKEIQETLQSGRVNWNSLVYQSSNQLVLPALFLNLKRNHLLECLPGDLVTHLEDITNQNRERNQAILNQIEEINQILNPEGLKPIYLKGTAHLLSGLYPDIAERMLSDIDFLLEENDARKAWEIVKNSGYEKHNELSVAGFDLHRHLIKLVNERKPASVEIHTRILEKKYHNEFNYSHLQSEKHKVFNKRAFVPSLRHQLLHNIVNAQFNENAQSEPKILLRNSYDLLLLSQKVSPINSIREFGKWFNVLNNYIALSADLLAYPRSLEFLKNEISDKHIHFVHKAWEDPNRANRNGKLRFIWLRISRYTSHFILFFVDSRTRRRIIKSLSNSDYRKAHWAMYKKWFS